MEKQKKAQNISTEISAEISDWGDWGVTPGHGEGVFNGFQSRKWQGGRHA